MNECPLRGGLPALRLTIERGLLCGSRRLFEHVERLLRLAGGDLQLRLFGCGQRTDVLRCLVTGWSGERLFRLFRIPQQSIAGGQMQVDLPSQRIVFAQLTQDTLELLGGQRQ